LRYRYTDTDRKPLSAAVVLDKNLHVTELIFGRSAEKAPD
jgi:hypothetical protein